MDRLVLDALNVSKSYSDLRVLDSFNLALRSGQIHGLLGPNGSGKSTCLHILTGLIPADSGEVLLQEVPITSKESRQYLGFAPDDLPLPEMLTGREYIEFHRSLRKRGSGEVADGLVEVFGMSEALNKQICKYSHGMKRKIQLIVALAHEPMLLVLDEPFRGLDPDAAVVLRTLIREFADSGRAVLMATHDMFGAERDCDEVTVLSSGKTMANGSPSSLTAGASVASLEEVFLAVTGLDQSTTTRRKAVSQLFAPA
ncbi:ABC transporter ATP-binding protein [Acaricomes phytoseiuli]|uniref:ABC transporter ATP-binding protein n=1 Tax=Acaricomes phytoseiuli TaxID=291968 RepID=UPI00036FD37B|nr:ABC transporter ATP-binding protein [Acaricomes phytoseiuli]